MKPGHESSPPTPLDPRSGTGPLAGLRVVEVGSIGPGPFCAMLLADLGAEVLRLDRPVGTGMVSPNENPREELLHRGRESVAVDLKNPRAAEVVLDLVERADVLIEGMRPGVAERLGIGPEVALERNPRLIYGRMTGFGQDGPLAQAVGHDINYVALSGVLSTIGRRGDAPAVPLSLVGDFGGGGMLLALGILAALHERQSSGLGQVIDAAMVEGAALLGTAFFGYAQNGSWREERGTNLVDSGAPFYDAYETADGAWLSVGALEPHFFEDLCDLLELPPERPGQYDRDRWPVLRELIAAAIKGRTREEWVARAVGRTPCIAPVLTLSEAPAHPHHQARDTFVEVDGIVQPAPAPRFSRTPAALRRRPPLPGEHTHSALAQWGIDPTSIQQWVADGAVVDRRNERETQ
ncbi:CaiB/BaiF CoA transferase family protein [Kribbia dieselivorans]|uniref:CaiB/BaiF CoA transferase family protein n=1 Tax=Kribbia dieselivorans TaxID=331526 RepID=UPI000A580AD4|nr:CaiB/BaiF CoA-transferase family protein [Kribbia dieselivorans]